MSGRCFLAGYFTALVVALSLSLTSWIAESDELGISRHVVKL